MKTDPWRITAFSTVAAIGILVLLLAILGPTKLPGFFAATASPEALLRPESLAYRIVWALSNGLYGLYFFLFLPLIWLTYRAMKDQSPLEAVAALPFGILALVSEGLGRWWHPVFEAPIVSFFHAAGDPEARKTLQELLLRYDGYHQFLHYLSYAAVVWSVLVLIGSLKQCVVPLWLALLGFTLVVGVGTFPPAAIVWAVPALLVTRAHGQPSSDVARGGRRTGARRSTSAARTPRLHPARRG
ncbi:MAG: hypothetical protein FJ315_05280 [SAR202 cluster bacterium]|nr:hypothetical protein [SAR202 cluster bacterium]